MHLVKHTKDNSIVKAMRDGLIALGRAQAQAGHQIFLPRTDWKPGDELVPVKVEKVEGDVAIGKDNDGDIWGFWL